MFMYKYIYTHTHECTYVYTYVCIYMCMYVHIPDTLGATQGLAPTEWRLDDRSVCIYTYIYIFV